MAKVEDAHEQLDTWGRMRRDAIQEWGSTANAYMHAGGRWNKVKSFVAGAYESAAELAPHSKWGLALDVGAIVAAPVVAGFHAARAGRALLQGAEAVHKALEVTHLGKSIAESAGVVARNAKPLAREVRSILGSGRPPGPKGGSGPASAPVIKLPPITITAGGRGVPRAPSGGLGALKVTQARDVRGGHTPKLAAAKPSVMSFLPTIIRLPSHATRPALPLRLPKLGDSLFRRGGGASAHSIRPKLGGFDLRRPTLSSQGIGAQAAARTSAAARMRLHAPRLGASLPMRPMIRQSALPPMARAGGSFRR